jgi:hypothetical protein
LLVASVTMRRNFSPGLHTQHRGHVAGGRIDKHPPDFNTWERRRVPPAFGGADAQIRRNRPLQEPFPNARRRTRLGKRERHLGGGLSEGASLGLADFTIGQMPLKFVRLRGLEQTKMIR